MTRLIERLKRIEAHRPIERPRLIMVWADDEIVTDDDGMPISAAEWRRRHPDAQVIDITWGDDD